MANLSLFTTYRHTGGADWQIELHGSGWRQIVKLTHRPLCIWGKVRHFRILGDGVVNAATCWLRSRKWYAPFYVYWTVHHLDGWIKTDQLDVTSFIISLFTAQHVSNVNTSIFRSLRLICWVISCVVLLWFDVCWCYGVVRLGWCGILMQAEAALQPA